MKTGHLPPSRVFPKKATGRKHIEDAIAGYLKELGGTLEMLDSRYEDLKNGRVTPFDGDIAFAGRRRKSQERRSRS